MIIKFKNWILNENIDSQEQIIELFTEFLADKLKEAHHGFIIASACGTEDLYFEYVYEFYNQITDAIEGSGGIMRNKKSRTIFKFPKVNNILYKKKKDILFEILERYPELYNKNKDLFDEEGVAPEHLNRASKTGLFDLKR